MEEGLIDTGPGSMRRLNNQNIYKVDKLKNSNDNNEQQLEPSQW